MRRMSKYMIRCDMEGASGVVAHEQAQPGNAEYASGRRMFMADLLALLEGLQGGDADEFVVYDAHSHGRNIEIDRIPSFASVVCGRPPYVTAWVGGIDHSFDGLILLGFHAKAGTENAILPHTYETDICEMRLNGVSVGEIGMEAALAGDFGVPLVMVSSDSAGVAEATHLVPGALAVIVKDAVGSTGGVCFPLTSTTDLIRAAATQLVKEPPRVKPYSVAEEVMLAIEFNEGSYLRGLKELCGKKMKNDRTLLLQGTSATDVWIQYLMVKQQIRPADSS